MGHLLPFIWQGFRPTTRYTFQFSKGFEPKILYPQMEHKVRAQIAKADQLLQVKSSEDLALLYDLVEKSFHSRNTSIPFLLPYLERLDASLRKRQQRIIYLALDAQEHPCAAIYLVWDQQCVYALMIGADPQHHSTGAVQRLLWEGIQLADRKKLAFDFEGSMVPSIFQMFRGFHATMVPYIGVHHSINWIVDRMASWKLSGSQL